jgi:hypothetical protein
MTKVRHILGISGGKDSAALALYLNDLYPELDIEYYTSDTGRELDETYKLIDRLESRMGRPIKKLDAVDLTNVADKSPFDHFLALYGGYLPSSTSRWCTKKLKLEPFESYISDQPTISYVGIRGDEDRDGYISKKQSVQSIFPFRKNIWSEDVNKLVLANSNQPKFKKAAEEIVPADLKDRFMQFTEKQITPTFNLKQKLNALLDVHVASYNKIVFELLKETDYPVGKLERFPLVDNEDNLVLDDIFRILEDSGVGIPAYYKPLNYEVEIDGEIKKGTYSRSRSGCFFCFYQQKIEWVWLYENHSDLFAKAMEYEKDGYSWMDTETLDEMIRPERIAAIKKEHYLRMNRNSQSKTWQDQIMDADGEGCASCFI